MSRRYRDWLLIDNIMLPSGQGTTQIDHILIAPVVMFLIETKDMNGWVFGRPGDRQWTQTTAPRRGSRKTGGVSRRFSFYNPLWQNEGHARALVKLGITDRSRLRPVVVCVGDAEMKTRDQFLSFDEHEAMAVDKKTWRMRGVICLGLEELHASIEFSIPAAAGSHWTDQDRAALGVAIRAKGIPITAESSARHIEFVHAARDRETPRFRRRRKPRRSL
ncbi:MAG: nuclease-related domain-containing protein [Rhodobacteraceae bacterium]|nr:nuclease-related domain-containing protein [Paracoccaceae bacterium]MCY4326296.1 nuclease-related domain-containing protein [Paracoccaceae bacterium]